MKVLVRDACSDSELWNTIAAGTHELICRVGHRPQRIKHIHFDDGFYYAELKNKNIRMLRASEELVIREVQIDE